MIVRMGMYYVITSNAIATVKLMDHTERVFSSGQSHFYLQYNMTQVYGVKICCCPLLICQMQAHKGFES